MKILILSDSHGSVESMEAVVARENPQAMVHLGDLWEDGKQLGRRFPGIPLYQVAGNCDRHSWEPGQDQILTRSIDGVVFYMTHGHLHGVKLSLLRLRLAAKEAGAQEALFGHTHRSFCRSQGDVLLVNPGACGGPTGTYAVLETGQGAPTCEIRPVRPQE